MYIFTKDLKQLKMDLEVTKDKSAVIRRYEDALVAKGEVRYKFWSNFDSGVLTHLEVYGNVRQAR